MRSHGLFCSAILIATVLLLWLAMAFNAFGIAPRWFFAIQLRDNDSAVIGKILQSHQTGILGSREGLGRYYGPGLTREQYLFQVNPDGSLLRDVGALEWQPYLSELGLQGFAAALADRALFFIDPDERLEVLRLASAFVTALAVAGFLAVLWRISGPIVAIPMGLSLFLAPWFLEYGHNLYLAVYLWFVPAIVMGLWLIRNPNGSPLQCFGVVGAAFVAKFMGGAGYAYAPSAGALAIVPLCLAYGMGIVAWRRFVLLGALTLGAFLAALGLTILVHAIVLGGNLDYIALRLGYRAGLAPCIAYDTAGNCLTDGFAGEVSVLALLSTYVNGDTLFGFGGFWQPLALGAAGWLGLLLPTGRWHRQAKGLLYAFPLGLLGAIAWYAIMKQHSFVHTHVNYGLWYLPGIGLGFSAATVSAAALLEPLQGERVPGSIRAAYAVAFVAFSIACLAVAGWTPP